MPCPHNEISIVQRSQQQSAVAAAAYQSGEKLFCGYDQEVKHYPEKRGIVHNEILLPANAPRSYADRNTLWNAAEAVEKQWNSQLARRWVLTIPREIPPDQYAALVRDFCNQQFVSKGMCVDFAIHDKGDGNPHAHVMLTMRAKGKWGYLNNFEFVMNKAYALNRDRLKCRVCGKWLIDHAPYTHRINPYLSLDKVNRVNNLISVHKKCYMAINTPGMDISDYEKQVQKKILSYREKLVVSHTRNN